MEADRITRDEALLIYKLTVDLGAAAKFDESLQQVFLNYAQTPEARRASQAGL